MCSYEKAKGAIAARIKNIVGVRFVPPDLTLLAQRHGGKFPDFYVQDDLRNGVTMPAHGPAEMPTWGADFRDSGGLDGTQVKLRIVRLSNYIKLRQTK